MKNLKTSLIAVVLAAVGSCTFVNFNSEQPNPEPTKTENVVCSVNTNQIESGATNEIDRALKNKPAQNVDWFIQNSNYIWDGWKLK